jgi:penicillin amidase
VPKITGSFKLEGLQENVQVYREINGMIHIVANNDHDLYMTQGAVVAVERLWQLEFTRRLGRSKLSEVLGNATLTIDKYFLSIGVQKAASESLKSLRQDMRDILQAYCDGINAYINTNPPLQPEFKLIDTKPGLWEPLDVMIWGKVMSVGLSENVNKEIARYTKLTIEKMSEADILAQSPHYPLNEPTIVQSEDLKVKSKRNSEAKDSKKMSAIYDEFFASPKKTSAQSTASNENINIGDVLKKYLGYDMKLKASNNWVIHGNRTLSGKPLLCNDPHLSFEVPSIWIMVHLQSPTSNNIGATFPATPGVVLGHNDYIAWGTTNVGADVQDLYIIDEVDATSYRHNGTKKNYEFVNYNIAVKDGNKVVNVTYTLKNTLYGPVMSEFYDSRLHGPLALRWTVAHERDTTLEAFFDINQAKNWTAFRAATSKFIIPAQNFVYADIEGNIGYQTTGMIPIRPSENTGAYPMPGNGHYDWMGYIPFEDLPSVLNPKQGYVASANNKVAPIEYPHSILYDSDWEEPFRAKRIIEMIEEKAVNMTVEHMMEMQADVKSLVFYNHFRKYLTTAQENQDRVYVYFRALMLEWDGVMSTDSVEAHIYARWFQELEKAVAAEKNWTSTPNLMGLVSILNRNLYESTINRDTYMSILNQTFIDTLKKLSLTREVDRPKTWGEVHKAVFPHRVLSDTPVGCIFDRSVPAGGDWWTVNVGPFNEDDLSMGGGASYRHVVDLGNFNNSKFIHPIGQNGNPFSKFYDNYLDMWQRVEYIDMQTVGYNSLYLLTYTPK